MANGGNQEDCNMQKLILSVPFPKETPIVSAENQSGTYTEECAICHLLSEKDGTLNYLHDTKQRGFLLTG